MHIFIEKTGVKEERDFTGTAQALLKELNINHTTVIVAVDRKLVPLDTDISQAKKIDILSIVSGG